MAPVLRLLEPVASALVIHQLALGRALLRVVHEDHRAVLVAEVRPLSVQLGRVVGHREVDAQNRPEGDDGRIECDGHRLRVAGVAGADGFVVRIRAASAGIAW